MQNRQGDLQEFFAHEVQSFPPSLSDFISMHSGKKSDLLSILEEKESPQPPATFDCKVLDGGTIAHLLIPVGVNTFTEYADIIFIPYLLTPIG